MSRRAIGGRLADGFHAHAAVLRLVEAPSLALGAACASHTVFNPAQSSTLLFNPALSSTFNPALCLQPSPVFNLSANGRCGVQVPRRAVRARCEPRRQQRRRRRPQCPHRPRRRRRPRHRGGQPHGGEEARGIPLLQQRRQVVQDAGYARASSCLLAARTGPDRAGCVYSGRQGCARSSPRRPRTATSSCGTSPRRTEVPYLFIRSPPPLSRLRVSAPWLSSPPPCGPAPPAVPGVLTRGRASVRSPVSRTTNGHARTINRLCLDRYEKRLLSASQDGIIKQWVRVQRGAGAGKRHGMG